LRRQLVIRLRRIIQRRSRSVPVRVPRKRRRIGRRDNLSKRLEKAWDSQVEIYDPIL